MFEENPITPPENPALNFMNGVFLNYDDYEVHGGAGGSGQGWIQRMSFTGRGDLALTKCAHIVNCSA